MEEKRRLWKIWKNGGNKEDYILAIKVALKQRRKAECKNDTQAIYRITKQIIQEHRTLFAITELEMILES